jgi:hypothetical protein
LVCIGIDDGEEFVNTRSLGSDAASVPMSRRQQKLAERKAKADEHNAKVKLGTTTDDTMVVAEGEEGIMDIDI